MECTCPLEAKPKNTPVKIDWHFISRRSTSIWGHRFSRQALEFISWQFTWIPAMFGRFQSFKYSTFDIHNYTYNMFSTKYHRVEWIWITASLIATMLKSDSKDNDLFASSLSVRRQTTFICVSNLGIHLFRYWLVTCHVGSHYLDQCWLINWHPMNRLLLVLSAF